MELNGSGQGTGLRAPGNVRGQIDRLRIRVTETANGVFNILLVDGHTADVAGNAGRGDWQRGIVSALATGLRMLDEMQTEETQAQAAVDGPATRAVGPRKVRVKVSSPQAIAGLDRIGRQTGTQRSDVVHTIVRTALALVMEPASPDARQ